MEKSWKNILSSMLEPWKKHLKWWGSNLFEPFSLVPQSKAFDLFDSPVYGTLNINDPLLLFKKSRVATLGAGFFFSSHKCGHPTTWMSGMGSKMAPSGKNKPKS